MPNYVVLPDGTLEWSPSVPAAAPRAREEKPRPSSPKQPRAQSQPNPSPALRPCPRCGLNVRGDRLRFHACGARAAIAADKPRKRPLVPCPDCGAAVLPPRLEGHRRERCPMRPTAAADGGTAPAPADSANQQIGVSSDLGAGAALSKRKSKPAQRPRTERPPRRSALAACPRCLVPVHWDRLSAHLYEAHRLEVFGSGLRRAQKPPTPSRQSPTRGPRAAGARTAAPAKSDAGGDEQRDGPAARWGDSTRTDREDAAAGIGFLAREGGRFGSFPSFDAMDDESGA